jgi:hypothetical protein
VKGGLASDLPIFAYPSLADSGHAHAAAGKKLWGNYDLVPDLPDPE